MNRFRRTKNGLELIPWEETEEYKVHQRAMSRFDAMTNEEKFQTFIDAGIYTEEGELTQRYGGTAPNTEERGVAFANQTDPSRPTFSALCFTTPFRLGQSFKRVRYNFHLNFFHLLHESDESDILWNEIADIFGEIWDLCLRHASLEDLEEHLPTVDGYPPEVLADWWRAWENRQKGAFLTSLVETLEFEADGDHARGRRILAKKLRKISVLLQKTREKVET